MSFYPNNEKCTTYLADASNAGVDVFADIGVLDGRFAEEKVDVVSNLEGPNEIRSCKVRITVQWSDMWKCFEINASSTYI